MYIGLEAVPGIIWCTYTALLRHVTFCGRCQWKVFHPMGTTGGTEQGCIGSSSWREIVVLAGEWDEEILITLVSITLVSKQIMKPPPPPVFSSVFCTVFLVFDLLRMGFSDPTFFWYITNYVEYHVFLFFSLSFAIELCVLRTVPLDTRGVHMILASLVLC